MEGINTQDYYFSIFGTGAIAQKTYNALNRAHVDIRYFVVSDDHKEDTYFMDKEVLGVSEYINICPTMTNPVLIIAVSDSVYPEIECQLKRCNNIHYIRATANEINRYVRNGFGIDTSKFITNTSPVSCMFGTDRGTPIDRYYMSSFIQKYNVEKRNGMSILEVGDRQFTAEFFELNQVKSDILDFSKGQDLTKTDTLEKDKYDLFICTQTLQEIYDIKSAIKGTYYSLKKGGVLLATVAGNISPVARYDSERWGYYWGFTEESIKLLFEEVFGKDNVEVEGYGNAATATAFVQGLALEDLDNSVLDYHDRNLDILIGIRAVKR